MSLNSFAALGTFDVLGSRHSLYRLDALSGTRRLPYSLKVLLENLLRNEDGRTVTGDQVTAVADWDPGGEPATEIQFTPARVLMQDFTGVPCLVDLVAMREAMTFLGGDPALIDARRPVELVIDHSVVADRFGSREAFDRNVELEYERNRERYQFLRWGQSALRNLRVVPPGTGICHQVNLEHLARVVFAEDAVAFPDTLVGTDSHTPMVNGLGVLGWGVGGIEAEAAMLGRPVSMLVPRVVGVRLTGALSAGTTATDLVLTIAERLRAHGVVGSFVEFYGPGVAGVPVANRATIGNMSPEYGATCAIFPIDAETLSYLRLTGRKEHHVALVEAYAKEQGLWHDPGYTPDYTETMEIDLSAVVPSIAGPKRPQDRVALADAPQAFLAALSDHASAQTPQIGLDEGGEESFPASDPLSVTGSHPGDRPVRPVRAPRPGGTLPPGTVLQAGGDGTGGIGHGAVVIAAITSCTNTSNPQVMVAAALLAKKAVERGLRSKPWVKTTLAPGSKIVMDYLERAGLVPYLEALGFDLVGYGCTTCIGNSGPLIDEVSHAVAAGDLTVASVLSGNRNFEGRIHPETKLNYLAAPPLVVAYALAGSMAVDLTQDPIGTGSDGRPVRLDDIWPDPDEIQQVIAGSLQPELFTAGYADLFTGDERWRALPLPDSDLFTWDPDSTYVRRPPYFHDLPRHPQPPGDLVGARVLALLGDSVTTDHISPAGAIRRDSPAGEYLQAHGVTPRDFNSYGSRRGNHEVMIRGTFANIRLRNRLVPGTEGGFTRHLPDGGTTTIHQAAMRYASDGVPLLVIAGKEYGSGSSRDWAAKGTALLGVKAVLAESFERIHRSNLIGMGVLPLQFHPGQNAESLGLSGEESYTLSGLGEPSGEAGIEAAGPEGTLRFTARIRLDTPTEADYYRHGGILPYALRALLSV